MVPNQFPIFRGTCAPRTLLPNLFTSAAAQLLYVSTNDIPLWMRKNLKTMKSIFKCEYKCGYKWYFLFTFLSPEFVPSTSPLKIPKVWFFFIEKRQILDFKVLQYDWSCYLIQSWSYQDYNCHLIQCDSSIKSRKNIYLYRKSQSVLSLIFHSMCVIEMPGLDGLLKGPVG